MTPDEFRRYGYRAIDWVAAFLDRPEALRELAAAYPRAQLLGCSTAGEILGARVEDGSLAVAVARLGAPRVGADATGGVAASVPRPLPATENRNS